MIPVHCDIIRRCTLSLWWRYCVWFSHRSGNPGDGTSSSGCSSSSFTRLPPRAGQLRRAAHHCRHHHVITGSYNIRQHHLPQPSCHEAASLPRSRHSLQLESVTNVLRDTWSHVLTVTLDTDADNMHISSVM